MNTPVMSITSATNNGQSTTTRSAIWEVMRRDVSSFWPLIVLWTIADAQAAAQVLAVPDDSVFDALRRIPWFGFGPLAIGLVVLIAGWSAFDDRPFDPRAFWRTRPLPPRAIAIAKILFVTLAASVPLVFSRGALALAAGMPMDRLPELAYFSLFGPHLVLGLWIALLVVVSSNLWRAFLLFVATMLSESMLYFVPWIPKISLLPSGYFWVHPLERPTLPILWLVALSGLLLLAYTRDWRWRSFCVALLVLPLISAGVAT